MLKLMVFAPCEKVIVNKGENTASLIGILETVGITIPESAAASLPDNVVVPFKWCIYTLWQSERGETANYEQRLQLPLPDGRIAFQGMLAFEVTPSQRNYRGIVDSGGFPIIPAGEYALKLSLRKIGEDNLWQDVAEYPISITRPS